MLGVDACRAGWVGIALTGHYSHAYVAGTIDELVGRADADGLLAVVAIDMPIGLPDRGRRQADVLARKAIGPLRDVATCGMSGCLYASRDVVMSP
ncbi:MAG: DUF429 domain-containing protein [Actinomycetes bacterium]